MGNKRYFSKVLVANRGEIAVRIIRACRELGIRTVAVYSEADRSALHVRLADEAYLIGPAPAVESYLRADKIVEAAQKSHAVAIHPGYGFLSERAHFARACEAAGIVFIGPSADAIERMGSKIAAKRLALAHDVPVVPGYDGDDQSIETLLREAARVGFPLLIKASAGGGGKGMRVVPRAEDFVQALEAAQREAKAAFGDDAVLLEKLILQPRHVEMQVFGDAHGNVVYLGERECSIQRRHQKIVEEAPSVALTPELRAAMGAAAVRVARAVGYRNAGTIEFMLDVDGQFYFLEMNTRLQVEHPVTEGVTGLDLVQLQLAVAAGEPLPFAQDDVTLRGHTIEARIYAEDPVAMLPSIGTVALFAPPDGPGVRNDVGLQSGDDVTVHYDPMLAKLIVTAQSRAEAIARMQRALADYAVLGVTTNVPLLQAIIGHAAFAAGTTTTDFLQAHSIAAQMQQAVAVPSAVLIAAALHDLTRQSFEAADPWLRPWRMGRAARSLAFVINGDRHVVLAAPDVEQRWRMTIDGTLHEIRLLAEREHAMTIDMGGEHTRLAIARDGADLLIGFAGRSYRVAHEPPLNIDALGGSDHGAPGHANLTAPMPGTIIKVFVQPGEQVAAAQPLIVMEAMKMEHTIVAPYAGAVGAVPFGVGHLVQGGATLVELDKAAD